jgi:archaellum component FlaC
MKSLERVNAPYGLQGENWYQFVIENDFNSITGFRSGKKKDVINIVTNSVNRLNETYLTGFKMKHFNKPANETSHSPYS